MPLPSVSSLESEQVTPWSQRGEGRATLCGVVMSVCQSAERKVMLLSVSVARLVTPRSTAPPVPVSTPQVSSLNHPVVGSL